MVIGSWTCATALAAASEDVDMMVRPFVILTGASGVGKTTLANAVRGGYPGIAVYEGDILNPISKEFMASIGPTEGPGGPSQRGFALFWIGQIAAGLSGDRPVLLDTQCRIAFLREALSLHKMQMAKIILVECDDSIREARLHGRGSPDLAHDEMRHWSLYLHREAVDGGCHILDTGKMSINEGVELLVGHLH